MPAHSVVQNLYYHVDTTPRLATNKKREILKLTVGFFTGVSAECNYAAEPLKTGLTYAESLQHARNVVGAQMATKLRRLFSAHLSLDMSKLPLLTRCNLQSGLMTGWVDVQGSNQASMARNLRYFASLSLPDLVI